MSAGYTKLVPGRFGWMVTLACDPYQSQSLELYGEWSHAEQMVLSSIIRPGDVILDCGANIGSRAIPFGAQVGPGGRVYAIEPQRLAYLCLCGSIALNSLGMTVYPLHAAVGATAGEIEVPLFNPTVPQNVSAIRLGPKKEDNVVKTLGSEIVPLMTVDGMNLERCNLLKIDVEGMEGDVVRGARETIARHQPTIWAESLPHEQYAKERDGLKSELSSLGYKAWVVITPVFSPANVRLCPTNPYENQADHNVYCIPKSVDPPEWVAKAKCKEFC